MMVSAFVKGTFLALGLVMPLGVQNTFVFNQAANQTRYLRAMPMVLTAIVADAFLIITAILGVDFLLKIDWLKSAISIVGIIFLLFMGFVMFRSSSKKLESEPKPMSVLQQVSFTLALALLNPHAILDTIVVIGSVSINYVGLDKHAFAIGCIFVDGLWFASLAYFGFMMKKFPWGPKVIGILNKVSAFIMWFIAIDLLLDLWKSSNSTL